jgi:topoisomerase IA-like protein
MYIIDVETNATLRQDDIVKPITLERGMELLAGIGALESENI